MLRRLLGPLLFCVAATLAYTGYLLPDAAKAGQLFASGRELTNITLSQLEAVEVQIGIVEKNTQQLADSTERVANVIPTKIPMPTVLGKKIPDIPIPGGPPLKRNAVAIAKTADSVHSTTENLKNDIPAIIKSVNSINTSLSAFEERTIRAMRATQLLVWLISAVVMIQAATLMSKWRQDVTVQPSG